MTVDKAVSELTSIIKTLGLPENAKQALLMLAQDPHGIEQEAVVSMVASNLNIPLEEASQVLLELYGGGLLEKIMIVRRVY